MAQKMTGALVFDERTDRYDIRFDLNSYYGGFLLVFSLFSSLALSTTPMSGIQDYLSLLCLHLIRLGIPA